MFLVKWKGKVYTITIAWPFVVLALAVLASLLCPWARAVRDLFA